MLFETNFQYKFSLQLHIKRPWLALAITLSCFFVRGQNVVPNLPAVSAYNSYDHIEPIQPLHTTEPITSTPLINQGTYSTQMAMHQADRNYVIQADDIKREILKDIYNSRSEVNIALPSFKNSKGSQHYRTAYAQLLPMQYNSFSAKKATFIVENAYYESEKDFSEFEETVRKIGNFLKEKMQELGLDENSNLDKNYLLFQFFADTLELKSKNLEHLPFEYDFDDFWGKKDWSKMFVHKLLHTGKGQCNSLPRLYLILAEEIGAVAHLALSPNHSYIKFQNDTGMWHNIELTNNMLTSDAFILNSGYVKVEAIQNKIFMHSMNDQELLSNFFSELALGYVHKYGYDEFVNEVLNTALKIHPNNITAQLSKANLQTMRLKYTAEQLGITQENFKEIKDYPELVQLYKSVLVQYETVDNLGYAEMPAELYVKWLSTVNEHENQQLNDSFNVKPIEQNKD
ncbi:hypothetical protein [Spongiimicrobium sp. 3-5]|uniref:hypothetical protein n=1 Tax=Spongiimicrobium sp. 3-5 TaxID=3332596 RepID=UPI0039805272